MAENKHVSYGWGAPSIGQQFPSMNQDAAYIFTGSGQSIVQLHIRGLLSDGERDRALKRLTKQIERELARREPRS